MDMTNTSKYSFTRSHCSEEDVYDRMYTYDLRTEGGQLLYRIVFTVFGTYVDVEDLVVYQTTWFNSLDGEYRWVLERIDEDSITCTVYDTDEMDSVYIIINLDNASVFKRLDIMYKRDSRDFILLGAE